MARLKDIAQQSGFAISTVSRALNNDKSLQLKPESIDLIKKTARDLGYQAKGQKQQEEQKPGKILIIHKDDHFIDQIDNAYYFRMRSGMESFCLKNDLSPKFIPYSKLRELDRSQPVRGVILMGNYERDQQGAMIDYFSEENLVTISLMNYFPEVMDQVTYDIFLAMSQLVDHLKDLGVEDFSYFSGYEVKDTDPLSSKLKCLDLVLKSQGGPRLREVIYLDQGSKSGQEAMEAYLKKKAAWPQALVFSNDPIACGALKALNAQEVHLPILSINGDYSGEITNPSLTSIDVASHEIGIQAIRLVLAKDLFPSQKTISLRLRPQLIERDSSRPGKKA
ncbi:MAG: LacI family DNA-binding transcriptional regulator [Tissierellia bacterium]|nr:LacI family DNA-binding transcriptional regulator [Tissierellia bacterium]